MMRMMRRSSARVRSLLVITLSAAIFMLLIYIVFNGSSSSSSSALRGTTDRKEKLSSQSNLRCLIVGPDADADAATVNLLVRSANQHMKSARLVVLRSGANGGTEKISDKKKLAEEAAFDADSEASPADDAAPAAKSAKASKVKEQLKKLATDRSIGVDLQVLNVASAAANSEVARFEALHDYLASSTGEECADVLLVDRLDLVFQQDIVSAAFDSMQTVRKVVVGTPYLTAVETRSVIGSNSELSAVLNRCVGEKALQKLAASNQLFSGLVIGSRPVVMAYVRAMESLVKSASDAKSECFKNAGTGEIAGLVRAVFHNLLLRSNALGDQLPGALQNEREQLSALVAATRFVPLAEQAVVLDVELVKSFNVDQSGRQVRSGSAPDRPLPALLYGSRRSAFVAQLLANSYLNAAENPVAANAPVAENPVAANAPVAENPVAAKPPVAENAAPANPPVAEN